MKSITLFCIIAFCLAHARVSSQTNSSSTLQLNELTVTTIRPPTQTPNEDDLSTNFVEFDVWGGAGGNFGGITIGKTAAMAGLTGGQPYIRIRADGAYSYMVENTPEGAEWAQSIGVYNGLDKLGNMGFAGLGPNLDYISWGFGGINGGGESWWNGQSVITLWNSGRIQFMQPMEGDGTYVRSSASEPTAYMVLAQGQEDPHSAPLKFVAGTNLATPEPGAVEFDGSNLYITDDNSTRQTVSTLESNQTITGQKTFTQDVEVSTPGQGIILTSPNGTKYRITVADDGTLQTTAV